MVLVTAAEAESPRRDLPVAARYMYLLPVSLYLIGILLVGLCVDYLDPLLPHQHVPQPSTSNPRFVGITTAARSPFVIAIQAAESQSSQASSTRLFYSQHLLRR